jgi:APA family basic amino acid/polyamine antiporter
MMYYLLTTQPKPSLFGLLIMVSGLLIYAIFRKQSGNGPAPAALGRE